eukprot:Nk52_evm85s223 gene=Nk52_evmTU85s223
MEAQESYDTGKKGLPMAKKVELDIESMETDLGAGQSLWKSMFISVFNITCAMVGAGIVGLPKAIALTSWSGIVLIVFCALASGYTGLTLGWCASNKAILPHKKESDTNEIEVSMDRQEKLRARDFGTGKEFVTYADIGYAAAGKTGYYVTIVCQLVNCLAYGILYLVLAADNLNAVFTFLDAKYWILIVAGCLLPFCFLRTMKEIAAVAMFGFLASVVVVVIIITESFLVDDLVTADNIASAKDDGSIWEACGDNNVSYGNVSFKSYMMGLSTIIFAYGGHTIFIRIRSSLPRRNAFSNGVIFAYMVCIILYVPLSVVVYYRYGCILQNSDFAGNILLAFPSEDVIVKIALLGITLHVMIGYVAFMNPLYLYCEEFFAAQAYEKSQANGELRLTFVTSRMFRYTFRTTIVGITVIVAEAIPFFGDVQSFIGATTVTALCFILPSWFYLAMYFEQISLWEKLWNVIVILVGLVGGVSGAIFAVISIVDNLSKYSSNL